MSKTNPVSILPYNKINKASLFAKLLILFEKAQRLLTYLNLKNLNI